MQNSFTKISNIQNFFKHFYHTLFSGSYRHTDYCDGYRQERQERTKGAADDVNLVLDAVTLADSGALNHVTNDVTTYSREFFS